MKKFLFVLFGVFVIAGAFAAGENIPTSKSYVDSKLGEKQDIIPANNGAAQVLTNTGTAGEYGTKGIYDANGAYATQTQNLVDAATMNAGVQNAIDSEFQCIEWVDPNDHSSDCLLMDVFGTPPQQILPTGYTALEYIESTGTQWIDTGIATNNNIGIQIDFQYTNSDTNEQILFGRIVPNFCFWRSRMFFYGFKAGTGSTGDFETVNKTNRHIFELNFSNNGIAKLDDNIQQLPHDVFSTTQTIYMFSSNMGNSSYHPATARIFSAQMTNVTELVRNFIPARRDSDGEIGMYDTVTNTFFTNAGTGEFIAGPVVNLYIPAGQ